MAAANPPNPMPWMARDAVVVPGVQHPLPKHPEKLLPNFNPESKEPAEDHVKKFMLAVRLLDVEHEDVVCGSFLIHSKERPPHGIFHLQLVLSLAGINLISHS